MYRYRKGRETRQPLAAHFQARIKREKERAGAGEYLWLTSRFRVAAAPAVGTLRSQTPVRHSFLSPHLLAGPARSIEAASWPQHAHLLQKRPRGRSVFGYALTEHPTSEEAADAL